MGHCGYIPLSFVKLFVGYTRPAVILSAHDVGMNNTAFSPRGTSPPTLGERIRLLRQEAKLTQAVVADQIGISRSHLARIETGRDVPGRETLLAVGQIFGVSLDWLANGHGDPRPAMALNEKEALLLFAFRRMPDDVADTHLRLMLQQTKVDA